jgi:hypothetical protein
MTRVYVAGPYTKPCPQANTDIAIDVADEFASLGMVPFIPHLTHFWELRHSRPYDFWLDYDNQWLPFCDAMFRIPGESSGADKEEVLANSLGIPVFRDKGKLVRFHQERTANG